MVRAEPQTLVPRAGAPQAVVVGGGPAGLVAALALAHFGVPTALVARRQGGDRGGGRGAGRGDDGAGDQGGAGAAADNRTTALLGSSVAALDALGVWQRCRGDAAPLRVLRILDDTRRLWRAPPVRFDAAEIGLDAFGWNIANAHLVAALWQHAAAMPRLDHIDAEAASIDIDEDGVTVRPTGGTPLRCRLAVGADGRNSLCRSAAGISITSRAIRQTALTFLLRHARPHHDVSTEFHTEQGPFTLVPLPGLRSSLVCVVAAGEARWLAACEGEALDREIERRSHSILGKVTVEPGRGSFALRIATANRLAARRVALVGEAAHLLPPIGAQGLNLGLRDGAALAEIAGEIHHAGGDIGGAPALAAYQRRRGPDMTSRSIAVDLLNRSLLTDFLPVQALRGLGLYALGHVEALRHALMREGVAPSSATPLLMRPRRAATPVIATHDDR